MEGPDAVPSGTRAWSIRTPEEVQAGERTLVLLVAVSGSPGVSRGRDSKYMCVCVGEVLRGIWGHSDKSMHSENKTGLCP